MTAAVLTALLTVLTARSSATFMVAGRQATVAAQVGKMVGQVVDQHLVDCHLVLMTTSPHSPVFSALLRGVQEQDGVVVVTMASRPARPTTRRLLEGLWGDERATCRALLLHLHHHNTTSSALRFLEEAGLWRDSETRVVVVGGRAGVEAVLLHHTFRNTAHALYLALHPPSDQSLQQPQQTNTSSTDSQQQTSGSGGGGRVGVYRRCLYCGGGQPQVQGLLTFSLAKPRLPPQLNTITKFLHLKTEGERVNLMGARVRTVAVPYFPYMDFPRHSVTPNNTRITPTDSLDTRLVYTFAQALNYTPEFHAEPFRSFGDEQTNGSFTGMVGQLQQELADHTTIVAPTPGRLRVIDFLASYPPDPFVITSLRPALLPANLALIRPFSGVLWASVVGSVVGWSVVVWVLQQGWNRLDRRHNMQLNTAFYYGWGALLEQPPRIPLHNQFGKVLVGWWLVFCLVISTGFKSSLIAHLTVQGMSSTLDTFQDLVQQPSWGWAAEPWYYKGAAYEYFAKHTDPVVQTIYRRMQVMVTEEAMTKVLDGRFSLINTRNYMKIKIASQYTDDRGATPYYTSLHGINIFATFGWGFRKGSPIYRPLQQLRQQLEDAGIIEYWTQEVIARRVRENRATGRLGGHQQRVDQEGKKEEPLGLHHLQGAFYAMALGCAAAVLTLLVEVLFTPAAAPTR